MAMKPETRFKTRILPKLKALRKTWVVKIQQLSKSGDPDILMCIGGVFVAIELKATGGKTSKLQDYKLEAIAKAGGIAIVLEPEMEEEILDLLTVIANVGSSLKGENVVITKENIQCLKSALEP